MAQVRLTEQAQNEIDAIIEYYERVGASDFAEVFEEQIIEKMRPPRTISPHGAHRP